MNKGKPGLRWRFAATLAASVLAVTASVGGAAAQDARKLIQEWNDLNSKCRGGSGDDPLTLKYCEARELLTSRIEQLGYTYGCKNDIGADARWRKDCPK